MRFAVVLIIFSAYLQLSATNVSIQREPSIAKGLLYLREDDILLSGSKWSIAVDINLNDYRQVIQHFFETINKITTFIETPTGKHKDVYYAMKTSLNVISREIKTLTTQATLIQSQFENLVLTLTPKPSRTRRGLINVGGTVLNLLFGTLDSDDLENIHAKIESIDNKTEGVIHIMNQQISYINESLYVGQTNARNIMALRVSLSTLNSKIFTLEEQLLGIQKNSNFLTLLVFDLSSMFRSLEFALDAIRDDISRFQTALATTANHKLSPYFVSPSSLFKLLQTIQPTLTDGISLLTNLHIDEVYLYYSVATCNVAVINGVMRLFISIPLKSPNTYFELYRAVAFPTQLFNHTASIIIKPSHEYFAITPDRQLYMEFDTDMLLKCQRSSINICPPAMHIRKSHASTCLHALFMGNREETRNLCQTEIRLSFEPVFYRPPYGNTWAYSVNKERLIIQCPDKLRPATPFFKKRFINGTGLITIDSNCAVLHEDFLLLAHTTYSMKTARSHNLHIPPVEDLFDVINNDNHDNNHDIQTSKGFGTYSEVNTILESIIKTDYPSKTISLPDWRKQLINLSRPAWYQVHKSPAFPFVSALIVVSLIISIIYARSTLKVMFMRLRNVFKKKSQAVPVIEPVIHEIRETIFASPTSDIIDLHNNPMTSSQSRAPVAENITPKIKQQIVIKSTRPN